MTVSSNGYELFRLARNRLGLVAGPKVSRSQFDQIILGDKSKYHRVGINDWLEIDTGENTPLSHKNDSTGEEEFVKSEVERWVLHIEGGQWMNIIKEGLVDTWMSMCDERIFLRGSTINSGKTEREKGLKDFSDNELRLRLKLYEMACEFYGVSPHSRLIEMMGGGND